MNYMFEVIGLVILCAIIAASCDSEGLKVNVNGKDYSIKIGDGK